MLMLTAGALAQLNVMRLHAVNRAKRPERVHRNGNCRAVTSANETSLQIAGSQRVARIQATLSSFGGFVSISGTTESGSIVR
jgi:hypothetical protein